LLREILNHLRTSPQYSPKPHESPQQLRTPPADDDDGNDDDAKGELLHIRYQASSTNKGQPPTKSLVIGMEETCAALSRQLGSTTGFRNYKVISGGHLLKLDEDPSRPIKDLNLGAEPFLLVVQVHDRSEVQEEAPEEGLTAVEVELLKHFDQLYDLLGLEEKLATEVRMNIQGSSVTFDVADKTIDLGIPEHILTSQGGTQARDLRIVYARADLPFRSAVQDHLLGHHATHLLGGRAAEGMVNRSSVGFRGDS
jgi:hypothetical protein